MEENALHQSVSEPEHNEKNVREARAKTDSLARSRKKGGQACLEKHGVVHYQSMGKRGGEVTKERHDAAYYRRIGALGRESRRKKKQERQMFSVPSANAASDGGGISDAKDTLAQ